MTQNQQLRDKVVYNLQAVTLYIYEDKFLIQPNAKTTKINSNIAIHRKTQEITEINKSQSIPGNFTRKVLYSCFLGFGPILNKQFMFFVETAEKNCTIQGNDIFEVKQVVIIPFDEDQAFEKGDQQKMNQLYSYISYLKDYLLKQGYYFSYTYDLTLSKTAYAEGYPTRLKYAWNIAMAKKLLHLQERAWFVVLLQGSIKSFKVYLQGKKMEYFLITRRSWKRGGTRYNARGVDNKGNVANFCETQQIIYLKNYCFSHVQIRGSVPLFWKQTGIYAEVQFYKTHEQAKLSFKKHFDKLEKIYNKIFCVNLLSKQKSGEVQLTMYFEQLIKQFNLPAVRYEFYDFHFACKGQKFQRANYLINKFNSVNKYFKYYIEDISEHKVVGLQQGVMRTNCLDCLDRTNLIQSKIAYDMLSLILVKCGYDLQTLFQSESLVSAADNSESSNSLIINLKNTWADNGDQISKHYTGTGSTHTNITRTGKRDMKGMIDHGFKSLSRFYKQYMEDNFKQEVIDILIGEHTETINLTEFQNRVKNTQNTAQSNTEFLQLS